MATTKRKKAPPKTMFVPAKNPQLAEIISIRSPAEARSSVRKLGPWADTDPARLRKAIRSATLAANRAEVSKKRKARPLGAKEMREMSEVAKVYRGAAKKLSVRLERAK